MKSNNFENRIIGFENRIAHFDKVNPAPQGAFFMPATALNYGNWLSRKPKSAGGWVMATT
nr:MAG TPA: hypothetical protein [Caudoviricetes sp.]